MVPRRSSLLPAAAAVGALLALVLAPAIAASSATDFESSPFVFLSSSSAAAVQPSLEVSMRDTRSWRSGGNDLAWARYKASLNTTGWDLLEVHTNAARSDKQQAFAAGFLEGRLTAKAIHLAYLNGFGDMDLNASDAGLNAKIMTFVRTSVRWLQQNIAEETGVRGKDQGKAAYWWQVALVLEQLQGMAEGYASACGEFDGCGLTFEHLLLMNLGTELGDINNANASGSNDPTTTLEAFAATSVLARRFADRGRCSALIKVLPGASDILFSHVTWSGYDSMMRIFKLYDLPLRRLPPGFDARNPVIPGAKMSFSSYPGFLFSGDDFYVLSSGLAVMETTIGYEDESLNNYIVPESTFEFVRNLVANRLASSGEQWTRIFAAHNSGTYNNEWMVLDFKLFEAGKPLKANTLWVLDQLPKYVERQDRTATLAKQSYWASYNIPSFPFIFNVSWQWKSVEKYGDFFSYEKSPRARIFRRDHHKVTDMPSMKRLMRYNDFKNDPLAACNCTPPFSAENAISARSDLNDPSGVYPFYSLQRRCHGGTDAKIVSHSLMKRLGSEIVSGPTHDQQPVFDWSTAHFDSVRHVGLPERFDFDWLTLQWES